MFQNIEEWKEALASAAKPGKIEDFTRFFKTGKGEYGEGDTFIGVTVPDNRKAARQAVGMPLDTYDEMLASNVHEHRLSALLALVIRYKKAESEQEKTEIAEFYLAHTKAINNWDLVDLSCEYIIGEEVLRTGDDTVLHRLSRSDNMWEQRMAVVANLQPVRAGQHASAIKIITRLLKHPHDLIQKANGWVLREIGKKDENLLRQFIDRNYDDMPRTTLRYAIEKMPETERVAYLHRARERR